MRPIRLELEGFTAYREYTVVDFEGAELFVLTGPTGSGKSSIIDAITFALYGSVPRYQNPNLVHPVISQGKIEAKVRFDFAVDDRTYSVVRVVRKLPRGGATTKEARLESGGHLIAGTADEITRKMREILGLNFEQFCTCVVLPQGDFARFLHEKPAQRQDLLTKLLGLDLYEKMGNLARAREAASKQKSQILQEEREKLEGATPKVRKEIEARVRRLEELKATVENAEPELARIDKDVDAMRADAARLEEEAERLEKLSIPPGLTELAGKVERARERYQKAREEQSAADEAVSAAERIRSALPDAPELKEQLRAHALRDSKKDGLSKAAKDAAAEEKKLDKITRELREADARLTEARAAVELVRRELAAHDLAAHLKAGAACPVCQRVVDEVPVLTLPPALSNAEKVLAGAERELEKVERTYRDAEKNVALANERQRALKSEIAAIEKTIVKAADPTAIRESLKQIEAAEAEIATARDIARKARENEKRFHAELDRLADEESRGFKEFEKARDAVAALEPPRTDREALGEAWSKLAEWAKDRSPRQREAARRAAADASVAVEKRKALVDSLRDAGKELGLVVPDERPRDAVVSALAEAAQEKRHVIEAIDRRRALDRQIASEREAAAVAGSLGQHLKSTGFERWLLEEAFRRLVSGATEILKELSSGQYSFEYDDKLNFEVVDHRNADERRSARTLSGGETFLASLALALTLAEQTAELAAEGSARIESLFLDEGFGTLDNDTLEIVASAIEDLGAKGRIVGLVTHQQSLADKIAVQFRVNKGPATSTVEKIVA